MRRYPLLLILLPFVTGCGGTQGGDTSFPTFATDPENAPIAGLGSRDGNAIAIPAGGTRYSFDDGQRSLNIIVPSGLNLPTTLTFGSTAGLSARASIETTATAPVGWVAESGTVTLRRSGEILTVEIDAAFVPDPSGNAFLSANISPGFRVQGIGEAE